MQTLEEYFAKRKKKDHMDEFDLNLHSENMSKAIQYVMDYFINSAAKYPQSIVYI